MESNLKLKFEALIKNRLLENDEQVEAFEEAMQYIANLSDPTHISLLCQAFDDDTEDYEVMFGLVHVIEAYDKTSVMEIATTEFVKAAPAMLKRAKEWLEVLLFRILNEDAARTVFAQVLGAAEKQTRSSIIKVLKKIAKDDPEEFLDKVNYVIKSM